jgi:tetratricopeptide (TPR) repeat protein
MKPNVLERGIIITRLAEAYDAYCNGQEAKAAELNLEAAKLAAQIGAADLEQHARRWQGNSLMWSGRHEEAFRVLTQAASYDQPDADPMSVYGAKTDRLLLSLSHAPAALCREMIRDARAYLERMSKIQWSHRVEMLEGVLYFRQGDYPRAAEFTVRAIRLADCGTDGPAYARASHLKWVIRPLFYSRQKDALKEWSLQNCHATTTMLSEQIRQGCGRLFALRAEYAHGIDVGSALGDEARNIAAIASEMRGIWDEVFEIGRALMLAGDWEALERLPIERMQALPFESALFAADREINWLHRKLELPPWDGDLDWPQAIPVKGKDISGIEPEVQKIRNAFANLHQEAARENQRMETNICTGASARRVEHVATLLPGIDLGQA